MYEFLKSCGAIPQDYKLQCFDKIASTSTYATEKALAGENLIVLADCQTDGRGRLGRSFLSEVGGLYLSFSYRPGKPLSDCIIMTQLIAVAVLRAVKEVTGVVCTVKPPNDILCGGKKICGILTEARDTQDGPLMVFGIGMNLTNALPPDVPHAGRLGSVTENIDKARLTAAILKNAFAVLRAEDAEQSALMQEYTVSISQMEY